MFIWVPVAVKSRIEYLQRVPQAPARKKISSQLCKWKRTFGYKINGAPSAVDGSTGPG